MATLASAARSGDKLSTLKQLRDQIAKSIQDSDSGRDIAALSKRLMEVMDEIERLQPPPKKMSPLDKARIGGDAP
ncbi:MAG: hypothetical protein ACI36T_04525 [Eggerthellaceae bacterium]